jgi:hypothetical protein
LRLGRALRETLVCALIVVAQPAWSQVAIPATPAGQALAAWLDAFNSTDATRIRAYVRRYEPGLSYLDELQLSEITRGFELRTIERSEPLRIEFTVVDLEDGTRRYGKLGLEARDGGSIVTSRYLWVTPLGSRMLGFTIDKATRDSVIEGAAAKLREFHMFRDAGEEMAGDLEKRNRRGEYDRVTDGAVLADMLTRNIRETGGDTHLGVRFVASRPPDTSPEATPSQARPIHERLNCFVRKVEVRAGNIGYLKLDGFEKPELCAATVTAAMKIVENVDSLIIDLRESTGGWPEMVAFIASYLFAEPTHICDMQTPSTNAVEEHWTTNEVPGKRLTNTPVYILASALTHSGSEIFVDSLKSRGRATVIGETTRGGAYETHSQRINDQFRILLPVAQAINPVTKTNWSGKGVKPDIPTSAEDALSSALELIRKRSKDSTHD